MDPVTLHEAAIIDEDVVRYERIKKKGTWLIFSIRIVIDVDRV